MRIRPDQAEGVMADRWYYQLLGEEFGPASREVLAELLKSNQLTPEDYVRAASQDQWVQFKTLPQETFAVGRSLEYADTGDFDGIALVESASTSEAKRQVSSASLEFAEIADLDDIDLSSPSTKALETPVPRVFADRLGLAEWESKLDQDFEIAKHDAETRAGNGDDSEGWYFDCFGQIFGPLTFEELCQKVQAGVISETDVVRQGESTFYQSVSAVAELRAYLPASHPPVPSSAQSSAGTIPVSSAPQKDTVPAPASSATESRQDDNFAESETPSPSGLTAKPPQPMSPIPDPAPKLQASLIRSGAWAEMPAATTHAPHAKQKRSWNLDFDKRSVAGFVLLLLVLGWLYFPDLRTYDSQYEALSALSTEFQALRTRKASAAEWDVFIKTSEVTITQMVLELEKASGGNQKLNMIRRYLMFAARDYWPEMVQSAREKPDKSEERFLYCMATVKNLMEDRPPPPPPADETMNNTKSGSKKNERRVQGEQ